MRPEGPRTHHHLACGLAFLALGLLSVPADAALAYRRQLSILGARVGATGAPHLNFPVLVSITDPTLRLAANGGHIYSPLAYDIAFRDSAFALLDWEIEKYDGVTGTLVAWVRIPSLPSGAGVNTIFYLDYGDCTVGTRQNTPANVWTAGFRYVYHLSEPSGNPIDSTANAIVATRNPNGDAAALETLNVPGRIGGAIDMTAPPTVPPAAFTVGPPATDTHVSVADGNYAAGTAFTFEAWVRFRTVPAAGQFVGIVTKGRESGTNWIGIDRSGTGVASEIWQSGNLNGTTVLGAAPGTTWPRPSTDNAAQRRADLRERGAGEHGQRELQLHDRPQHPPRRRQPAGNLNGTTVLNAGTWYYVAATFNSTPPQRRKIFVNGALQNNDNTNAAFTTALNTRFGDDSNGNWLDGQLDEVRFSLGTARSVGWIQTSFNNQNSPATFYTLGAESSIGVPNTCGVMLVESGTYAGNGADNRPIFVGFQPDVVFVKARRRHLPGGPHLDHGRGRHEVAQPRGGGPLRERRPVPRPHGLHRRHRSDGQRGCHDLLLGRLQGGGRTAEGGNLHRQQRRQHVDHGCRLPTRVRHHTSSGRRGQRRAGAPVLEHGRGHELQLRRHRDRAPGQRHTGPASRRLPGRQRRLRQYQRGHLPLHRLECCAGTRGGGLLRGQRRRQPQPGHRRLRAGMGPRQEGR